MTNLQIQIQTLRLLPADGGTRGPGRGLDPTLRSFPSPPIARERKMPIGDGGHFPLCSATFRTIDVRLHYRTLPSLPSVPHAPLRP
ncbi:hypothetical protein A3H22_01600 [Candidatus Peribacteria bacterium RIFCSPLOWO2_12_FULL_55_15]|nr:MAG: hypothetical protein A2947_01315 [Candidatus Peribacteria bacterium RIFCSPLOWO2_01_FULL_54_110]OGJ72263.1 MAG: hypothetical protein A3H22_01600 [Candidatus Peribacteria bacterium RIFCSPLOWO2_12_FULL_55_15]